MGDALVSAEHLVKRYGSQTAVDDVSLSVGAGEVVGLLGPNGAGKTTTIELLEGLRAPTSGLIRVLGCDPRKGGRRLKNRVGVVLQSSGIDATSTVAEVVALYAALHRPRRPTFEVLETLGLTQQASARVARLSGGQRRRLDLALALVGEPAVLFLDEPTTGLDPAARRATWSVIASLRRRDVAIVLSSHYLDEIQQLADRVVVLGAGRVVAQGAPETLTGGGEVPAYVSFRLPADLPLPPGPWECEPAREGLALLRTVETTESLRVLLSWAQLHGIELEQLEVRRPSLEERYLELTGS